MSLIQLNHLSAHLTFIYLIHLQPYKHQQLYLQTLLLSQYPTIPNIFLKLFICTNIFLMSSNPSILTTPLIVSFFWVTSGLLLENKNRRWSQNAQLKHDYLLWHMHHMIHYPHLKFSFLKKRRGYQRADKNFAIAHLMRYNKQNDEYLIKRYQGIAKNKFRTYRRYFENRKHKDRLDFSELIYRNSKNFV